MLQKNKHQKQLKGFLQGEIFVLQYLFRKVEPAVPGDISKVMGISTARIATALNGLENKGLISRQIDKEDRRRILVHLTEAGKESAIEYQDKVYKNVEQTLIALGEQDAKEYVRIMGRLAEISNSDPYLE